MELYNRYVRCLERREEEEDPLCDDTDLILLHFISNNGMNKIIETKKSLRIGTKEPVRSTILWLPHQ